MKVAIVHYWLFHMRGGEKVLEALCEIYPQADIYTHVYDPRYISEIIREHRVETTFIQKLPFSAKLYKKYLPLMPMALEQIDLSDYDLVISSESGPAKGIIARADALHVCYCHTPMRYLWDQYHVYHESAGALSRMAMPYLLHRLRRWDVTSAARVDHFIANSQSVAMRIQKYWRRDSDVISPPVDVDQFQPSEDHDDFYLCVSELVPYKRIDLAVTACNMLDRRLVVIGDGPCMKDLRRLAGPRTELLGHLPQPELREYLARCRALLFPAYEDFGIVPVEAMASGRPVIAYSRGGARDTVIDKQTGLLFHHQTVSSMAEAIIRFELIENIFDPAHLAAHAAKFSRKIFKQKFQSTVDMLRDDVAVERARKRPSRAALQAI